MSKFAPESARGGEKRHSLGRLLRETWGSWLVPPAFVALSVALIFSMYGWSLYHREARELNQVFDSNYSLLARAIEVASEHALRDSETEDLVKLITSLERLDALFEVFIIGPDGQVWFSSTSTDPLSPEMMMTVSKTFETGKSQSLEVGAGVERDAIRTASLDVEGERKAVLMLRKPMGALLTDLGKTRRHAWSIALLLAAASMFVSTTALFLRVRAPLRRIRQTMSKIQDVDDLPGFSKFSSPPLENDIRHLAETFEAMMARLSQSRAEVLELHRERQELTKRVVEQDGRVRLAQFASELAHEIGSPLQIIMGRAAQLEARADRPDDVRRNARIVVEACERVQRAVEASLRAAYLQPRGVDEIDIVERIGKLRTLFTTPDVSTSIVFTERASKGSWPVTIDEDAFDQIARNLLSNAIEASVAEGSDVWVDVYDDALDRWLVVKDFGQGIPDSMLSTVFKPWVTTKEGGTGHGFGLPIVERLCRDLGLKLELHSEIGVGTEARIGFPHTARGCVSLELFEGASDD